LELKPSSASCGNRLNIYLITRQKNNNHIISDTKTKLKEKFEVTGVCAKTRFKKCFVKNKYSQMILKR